MTADSGLASHVQEVGSAKLSPSAGSAEISELTDQDPPQFAGSPQPTVTVERMFEKIMQSVDKMQVQMKTLGERVGRFHT